MQHAKETKRIAIIGGGAAGFFAAFSAKKHHPDSDVIIYEKSGKVLSKVKVSGGGRCNVTNACKNISTFLKHYPRGNKALKKVFSQFHVSETVAWFQKRGVDLKAEQDLRMFPITDSSQTIIDCFLKEVNDLNIEVKKHTSIDSIIKNPKNEFELFINDITVCYDNVIIATGGSPKMEGFNWLAELAHRIIPPVPSLFTFNMPKNSICKLMGVSVSDVSIRIKGSKEEQSGPLLITHWGISGPAVLKLSAWAARELSEVDYQFSISINWVSKKENELRNEISNGDFLLGNRQIKSKNPFNIPQRLWEFFLQDLAISPTLVWSQLGKKNLNRLINKLVNDEYEVNGKTTFKEEFVTCGGVDLANVDMNTMQSKKIDGMYFAGEVLDIDGVTGGFNFQAAWSTAYVAGKLEN